MDVIERDERWWTVVAGSNRRYEVQLSHGNYWIARGNVHGRPLRYGGATYRAVLQAVLDHKGETVSD